MKKVLYYNTSFDAELAGNFTDRIRRLSAEMSVYALLAAEEGESVICDAVVDEVYVDHLRSLSFHADISERRVARAVGNAWGWSERSLNRLESSGCECDHPSLETVKRVNNRAFGIGLAKSIGFADHGETVSDPGFSVKLKQMKYPILVKPLHGSSGMGHRVIENPSGADEELRRIISDNPSGISVEPLLSRIDDFAANFILAKDGSVSDLTFHQCVTDNRGTFRGIKMRESDVLPPQWMNIVMKSVDTVAGALHAEGYFGHAGIDMFTYRDVDMSIRIHPLCEINARRTMGDVARACRRTLGGKYGLLRQIPSSRCGKMEYPECFSGDMRYDGNRRRGVCMISPEKILFDGLTIKPALVMIYAAADTETELSEMERMIEDATIRKNRR